MSVGNCRAYVERARSSKKKEEARRRSLNIGRWSDCVPSREIFTLTRSSQPINVPVQTLNNVRSLQVLPEQNILLSKKRRAVDLFPILASSVIIGRSRKLFSIATRSPASPHSFSGFFEHLTIELWLSLENIHVCRYCLFNLYTDSMIGSHTYDRLVV